MVASEAGARLGWRLHSQKVNMALALALTSVTGGVLAALLPVVFLPAAVSGIAGGLLLFSGFQRLPRSVRIMGGAGCGLFLAALPYLTTQFGGGLIAGIIFISAFALLNVSHAVIVLCVLMGCVCGALGCRLGSLLGGDGSSWSLVLGIFGGLAGLGASLLGLVFLKKLFPSRERKGAVKRDERDTARAERAALWPALVVLAALLAVLSACWIIPLRLGLGANASFYKFGFIGDEYFYAERCQPLLTATTATNSVNGFCDANVVSQWYLEDSIRALLTFTGLDVTYFYWLWRFVFPLLFFGAIGLLAHECLPEGGVGRWRLWLGASAAFFISVYVVYDWVTGFPPLQGWLNRIPTNLEYLLAALLAWTFIRLVKECNLRNGWALAILSAVIIYERIYAAFPWGLAIFLGVLILLALGRLKISVGLAMLTVLFALLSLWLERSLHNQSLPVQAEILNRCVFKKAYMVHPQKQLYLELASGFMAAAWLLGRRWWPLTVSATATMAALPFITGLLPVNQPLLVFDRYGVFYLLLTPLLVLLVLCKHMNFNRVGKWPLVISLFAFCGAAVIGVRNAQFDFVTYQFGPYESIDQDLEYLPAYQWVWKNTPPDALFLVDDGHYWSITDGYDPVHKILDKLTVRADLFQIVAKRRRVFQNMLYFNALSNSALNGLWLLHIGTFGITYDKDGYLAVLRAGRPDYIFWRKGKDCPPVPRGWGRRLEPYCVKVYEDQAALIWKLTPAAFSF